MLYQMGHFVPRKVLFCHIWSRHPQTERNWGILMGHGVSYSILEGIETENAYKVLSEMKEDYVLPPECKDGVFTMMIADNIDRNEEIFSGEFSQNIKGKSLTHSLL